MAAHILLDARKLGDFGIGVYIENLVHGLVQLQEEGKIEIKLSLLVPPALLEPGAPVGMQEFVASMDGKVQFVKETSEKYSLSEFFLLPFRQRKALREADLYHSPHYTLPFFLGIPAVVTIHDVIHLTRPESRIQRFFAYRMIKSAVKRAAHLISVSEESVRRLTETVGTVKTPMTVTSNALQEGFEVLPRSEVSDYLRQNGYRMGEYCLFVGNERPHKGFTELLHAWADLLLHSWGGINVPELIAVGERYSSISYDLVQDLGLKQKVRFVGRVPRELLTHLYNGAQAVIVPSKEEGFGLVALEALACGVPVVCTPHASFREVCGDCAWYARDFTGDAIAAAVRNALTNVELRQAKVEEGLDRVLRFTRAASAEKTCQVYETVLREQWGETKGHPGLNIVFRNEEQAPQRFKKYR